LLIWKKIEELDLWSTQDKKSKYLKWKLAQFTKFLEDDFSLIEQWHYMSLGMALWMVVGLAIAGITWLEFGMGNETTWWLVAGMVIWMFIWSAMDSKAKKENRIFKIK
jgi:hypothetical protein